MIVTDGWNNEALTSYLDSLWAIGAIKGIEQSPEGKGFRLALHERNPDAPLSPFYFQLRKIQSHPSILTVSASFMEEMVVQEIGRRESFDRIAGIPTASTPLATTLSLKMGIGQVMPRMQAKSHGTKDAVDGDFTEGQTVLLVDDLITEADSKLRAIEILKSAGLIVRDVVVLIDREQGGKQKLEAAGYKFHSIFTVTEVFSYYLQAGECTQGSYERVMEYIAAEAALNADP